MHIYHIHISDINTNARTPCYPCIQVKPTQTNPTAPHLLRKVPQLGQLIQQLLQIPIGNLILQTRD